MTDIKYASKRRAVIIVDECDEVMFDDLIAFYKRTKQQTHQTICLTATASDGYKQGSESMALKALDFQIYQNGGEIGAEKDP